MSMTGPMGCPQHTASIYEAGKNRIIHSRDTAELEALGQKHSLLPKTVFDLFSIIGTEPATQKPGPNEPTFLVQQVHN
jgi:hypothetical protein